MTQSSSLPPLEGLTAVVAAAERGSFSAAAEELGLTQSAVSRRVAAVEAWLGTPLFERRARGVALTPAGHRFVQTVDEAFALIARFAEQWRPGRSAHVVRVSATPSMARLWLLPRIAALQGDPPDVRIELLAEHKLARLDRDEADIAIRYGTGGWGPHRTWRLLDETLTPVAAPALARRRDGEWGPADIARLPLLHDSDTKLWRAWLADTGVKLRAKAADRRFEDYDMVLLAAQAGLGVALARAPMGDDLVRRLGLVRLTERTVANPRSSFVVVREDEDRDWVLGLVDRLLRAAGREAEAAREPSS